MQKDRKKEIIAKFARKDGDTGSPEVQCALLTETITSLTAHLKENPSDFQSRRGLLAMVKKRKQLLKYLECSGADSVFEGLVTELNIRR